MEGALLGTWLRRGSVVGVGLFKRHRRPEGHDDAAGPVAPDGDDVVEVAVLELWRSELAVEALRNAGIRAASVEAHGRRPSWAMEASVELITHEHRLLQVPTARILVHKRDAGIALRVLCELQAG